MTLKKETLNFVLMGAKHTGKTVYLSTLYGAETTITTKSKSTKDYLQGQWDYLKNEQTPSATSARLILLDLVYKSKEYNVPFRIDDYDGYFAETLSNDDPATQADRDALKYNIKNAEGVLLFFPYEDNPDMESIERFRHEINTFINLVREAFPNKNNLPIPVVIYVSKWDRSPYFKSVDENERVLEYIDSIEHYKVTKEMVENYFFDVTVIPFSSFGISLDGNVPQKNKIQPYNLTTPFDFFLDYFFSIYAKKVTSLQTEKNLPALFEFLFQWMHVVRFYSDEKFHKIYMDISRSYQDEFVSQLAKVHTKEEFDEILEENIFFYENFENESFEQNVQIEFRRIQKEESEKKRKKRNKQILRTFVGFFIVGLISLIGFEFIQYEKRSEILTQIRNSTDLLPYEQVELTQEYFSQFALLTNYLPGIDEEKAEVESWRNSALAQVRKILSEKYEADKDLELTEENLRLVKDLSQATIYYQELDISNRINTFAEDFEKRYQDKIEKIRKRNDAIITAKNVLSDTNADLGSVIDAVECLQAYDGDEELSLFTQLEIKRSELVREEKFNNILSELNGLSTESINQLDISKIIQEYWDDGFTFEQRELLKKSVDEKFRSMDAEAIDSLQPAYEIEADVDKDFDRVSSIQQHTLEIERLNNYRYMRNHTLADRLNERIEKIDNCKEALERGVFISSVTFIATSEDNSIGFKYGGISNADIILDIDGRVFDYDDGTCSTDGQRQVMTWFTSYRLRKGSHNVLVIEKDLTSYDDEFRGSIIVNDEDILRLMETGKLEVVVNTDYLIGFSK